MKRPENDKWLDEALSEAIGAEKSRTDFEQWKQKHPEAVEMLTSRSKSKTSTIKYPHIIRIMIMRSPMTKFAAAATIIIAVFLVLYLTNGPDMATVAWGEVVQNIEKIKCFTFQHKVSSKTNSGTPEETSDDTERTTYVSAEYGIRHDVYNDGQLTGILYIPSTGIDVTYIMPVTKQYMIETMSEEYMKQNQVSPVGMIKEFMSSEHIELGREKIDGVEAEGIEVNEPGFYGFESTVGRLWIDIETNLPVRMEIEGIRGATETSIITYDFNWDTELDQSIFQLNIPDDYTLLEK